MFKLCCERGISCLARATGSFGKNIQRSRGNRKPSLSYKVIEVSVKSSLAFCVKN